MNSGFDPIFSTNAIFVNHINTAEIRAKMGILKKLKKLKKTVYKKVPFCKQFFAHFGPEIRHF